MASSNKTWVNNNPPTCEDDDLNGFQNENNNLIEGSGQTLDTGDNQQTHKAVSVYASGGNFYTDGGSANAYVLSPVGSKVSPPAYFNGMSVRFVPNNASTSASTINVDGLGVKDLKTSTGTITSLDTLAAGVEYSATYFSGSDEFRLISPTGLLDGSDFSATIASTQTIAHNTATKVALATEQWDRKNDYDHTLYRFTPLVEGVYRMTVGGSLDFTTAAGFGRLMIYKNGVRYRDIFSVVPTVTSVGLTNSGTVNVEMNGSTDYLEMWAFNTSGAGMDILGAAENCYFQGVLYSKS